MLKQLYLWLAALFMSALSVRSAMAQQLGQGSDAADLSGWRILATLIFLGLLVVAAAYLVRSRSGSLPFLRTASERRVKILETIRISPQAQLCLMEFEGREYLIAFAAQGATVIETRVIKNGEGAE